MKRMSDNYGKLLLAHKSIGQSSSQFDNCHSSLQFKTKIILNQKLDEQFYEFLIKLYIATLKKAFTLEQDKQKVSEEVARMFRGNCFNKIQRDYETKLNEDRYPILREELTKNLDISKEHRRQQFVAKMEELVRIPK